MHDITKRFAGLIKGLMVLAASGSILLTTATHATPAAAAASVPTLSTTAVSKSPAVTPLTAKRAATSVEITPTGIQVTCQGFWPTGYVTIWHWDTATNQYQTWFRNNVQPSGWTINNVGVGVAPFPPGGPVHAPSPWYAEYWGDSHCDVAAVQGG